MQNTHAPVLLEEVLDLLRPQEGETIIDATLGLGGHAAAFLKQMGNGRLIGIDADTRNLEAARQKLQPWESHISVLRANFSRLPLLELPQCDCFFADLGLSSPHLDDPARGFSFRGNGPLDMRYDQSRGQSAAEVIAKASEEELSRIFVRYGEMKHGRRLASALFSRVRRGDAPVTTLQLRSLVEELFGYRAVRVLPQVFQALRIAVNAELNALAVLLEFAPQLLKKSGRFAVISYHSLEDRLVKRAFRELSLPTLDGRTGHIAIAARFTALTRKPVMPGAKEIETNPRSRSAILRAIQRA